MQQIMINTFVTVQGWMDAYSSESVMCSFSEQSLHEMKLDISDSHVNENSYGSHH